jgi:N-acetylneuraminate synthase
MKVKEIKINGHLVGPAHPPYIVAELSGNHNGDINRAFQIMEAAKKSGAHAVKIQTYTADTITIDHDGPEFLIEGGLWDGNKLYDLYEWAHTPWEWHEALFGKGRELGLAVFSTPFDGTAVDFLEDLDSPVYKIASFEVIDLPLIAKVASTGKPMIISTGMATFDEIREATETARNNGCGGLVLLHCVSGYPTMVEDSNLRTIPDLAEKFGVIAGLSDHTLGPAVPVAGVALGACLIEKHLTIKRSDGGPDAAFSLEPGELKKLCDGCAQAWESLGRVNYDIKPSEDQNQIFRRSIYVVEDISSGEELTAKNIRSIRPGNGLPPKELPNVLGLHALNNMKRGTALRWEDISSSGTESGEKKI